MAVDLKSALAFQDELRSLLADVPAFGRSPLSLDEQEARVTALHRLENAIKAKGGTVEDRWDGARINLFGLRATSTMGLAAASRNWLAQLTLKAGQAVMAGVR